MNTTTDADCCDGQSGKSSHSFQEEESANGVQFSPPLYLQRYKLAVDYLANHSVKTVIDFGCSECGFFRLLSTVPSLQEIALVDIDKDLLMSRTRVISPQVKDYVHRRSNPLGVYMYAGSAGDFDERMKAYQAVTLIEVIEHLFPDVLESVTRNVFGAIHPQHIIVTTPNSEFNVLFGNDNPTAFRHWDHKFEWTREQFKAWCQNVSQSYGYQVDYTGVGFQHSTQNSSDYGPCTQAAFFKRIDEQDLNVRGIKEVESREVYELIAESHFPYEENKMSKEEKLDLELNYTLRQLARFRMEDNLHDNDDDDNDNGRGGDDDDDGGERFSIEVCQIANRNNIKQLATLQEVRECLRRKKFDVSEDGERLTLNVYDFMEPSSDEYDDDDVDVNEQGKTLCSCHHIKSNDKASGCGDEVNSNSFEDIICHCNCKDCLVEVVDSSESWDIPVNVDKIETGNRDELWDTPNSSVVWDTPNSSAVIPHTEDGDEFWDTLDSTVMSRT